MNNFARSADGTLSVPASGEHIARIFSTGKLSEAMAVAIEILGEENFKALTDYMIEMDGVARDTLIESVCEAWQSAKPVADTVNLLSQLPASTALKAKLAQLIGAARPDLPPRMLPFYRLLAGF